MITPPDDTPLPAELAALLAELPDEITPDRDLWRDVHDAIAPIPRVAPSPRRIPWAWVAAGLAATLAVATTSAWLTARSLRSPAPVVAREVPAAPWEQELRESTEELEAVLAARRPSMDPEAVATVERALREIDAAILDIREALREDPDSEALNGALAAAWQHKVQVLRAVPDLP